MTLSHDGRPPSSEPPSSSQNGPSAERSTVADVQNGRVKQPQQMLNQARSWFDAHAAELHLLGPVAIYLGGLGLLLFQGPGLLLAGSILAALAALGHRIPADTMLSLYRAEPIAPGQGLALRAAVEDLSARAKLGQAPALAIIPTLAIGAFSIGSGTRQAILLTEGLLRRRSLQEIVAIAAHEIGHLQAAHQSFFALADTTTRLAQALFYAGVVLTGLEALAWVAGERFLSWIALAALLAAPTLNSQLQLRLPRAREYEADAIAAALLGDADGLITVARSESPNVGTLLDDVRLPVPQRHIPLPSPVRAHFDGMDRADSLQAAPRPLGPKLRVTDEPLISLVGVGPIEMRPRNRWPGLWF